jgi:hypothetical protein
VERHYVAAIRKELATETEPGSGYHVPPTEPTSTVVEQTAPDCKVSEPKPGMRDGLCSVAHRKYRNR